MASAQPSRMEDSAKPDACRSITVSLTQAALAMSDSPTVTSVCHAMVRTGQSACVILDNDDDVGKLKGLLTAGDVVRNVIALGLDPSSVQAATVMKKDMLTIVESTSDKDPVEMRAMEVMTRCGLEYIAVTDDEGRFIRLIDLVQVLESHGAMKSTTERVLVNNVSKGDLVENLKINNTQKKQKRLRPLKSLRENLATLTNRLSSSVQQIRKSTSSVSLQGGAMHSRELRRVDSTTTLQGIARLMRQDIIPACLVEIDGRLHLVTERLLMEAVTMGSGMVAKNGPTIAGFLSALQGRFPDRWNETIVKDFLPQSASRLRSQLIHRLHPHRLIVFYDDASQLLRVMTSLDIARRNWLHFRSSSRRFSSTSSSISSLTSNNDEDNGRFLKKGSSSRMREGSFKGNKSQSSSSLLATFSRLSSRSLMRTDSFKQRDKNNSNPHLVRMPSGKTAPLTRETSRPVLSVRSRKQLDRADECIHKRDFVSALRHLSSYLETNSLDGPVFLKRAILLQNQLQRPEDAVEDLKTALGTHRLPDHERREALIMLCVSLVELKRLEQLNQVWDDYNIGTAEDVVAHGVMKSIKSTVDSMAEESLSALDDRREYEKALRVVTLAISMAEFLQAKQQALYCHPQEDDDREQRIQATMQTLSAVLLIRSRARLSLGMLDASLEDVRKALDPVPTSAVLKDQYERCVRALDLQARVVTLTTDIENAGDVNQKTRAFLERARVSAAQGCFVRASKDFRQGLRLAGEAGGSTEGGEDTASLLLLKEMIPALRDFGEDLGDIVGMFLDRGECDRIHVIHNLTPVDGVRRAVLRIVEERIRTHLTRGTELTSSVQIESAVRELTSGIDLARDFEQVCLGNKLLCSQLYLARASCLLTVRDYQAALQDCDAAVFLNPRCERGWIRKCQCLLAMDNHEGFVRCAMETKRRFGCGRNPEIAELVAKAMSVVPDAAVDAQITSDDLFSLSGQ